MKIPDASAAIPVFSLMFAAAALFALARDDEKLLRERAPNQRPTLMVLGTAHFSNPGRDLCNVKVDDVFSPRRQREINAVVEPLASFRPAHVAVEWPRKQQDALEARYRDYREGRPGTHAQSRPTEIPAVEARIK